MAHEIAHVMEGTCRHSDEGIMKARWNYADYREMGSRHLRFASVDVELIHQGLAVRTARPVATA